MRILLSEGASTSARQAITALGLKGHEVEICDPDPHCLGRFSRFVSRFHRCPGLGVDPEDIFSFVLDLLASRRFDVLLPIHEQGFLFAALRHRIPPHVGIALPSFESYERVHSKVGFSRLLSELNLPQPETRSRCKRSRPGRGGSLSLRPEGVDRNRQPRHLDGSHLLGLAAGDPGARSERQPR